MNNSVTDKKSYLEKLLENSSSLASLPDKERKIQIKAMLSGNPGDIDKFIKILEEEKSAMQKINADFIKQGGEIEHLVAEAKHLEENAKKEILHEKEEKTAIEEEKTAKALLNKLEKMKND